jgi:hypothetical protein
VSVIGIREALPKGPIGQLDVMACYLATMESWVTSRVFHASIDRLNAIREALVTPGRGAFVPIGDPHDKVGH